MLELEFLQQEKYTNAFAISQFADSDTERFLFYNDNNEIGACLTRMKIYCHFVSSPEFTNYHAVIEVFEKLLKDGKISGELTGSSKWVKQLVTLISAEKEVEEMNVLYLDQLSEVNITVDQTIKYTNLTEKQIPEYQNLFEKAFGRKPNAEVTRKNLSKIHVLIKNNEIICTASRSTPTSISMITGVATKQQMQKQGYAKYLLTKMCNDLVKQNTEVVLFTDNPIAQSLYEKIGFKLLDTSYMMVDLKKCYM